MTWKPRPVSAPKAIPSSGPRITPGAASAIIATPQSLSSSSFSGAVSAADQFEANVMPAWSAQIVVRPWLAIRAQPVAAVAPHSTAAADQDRAGDTTGRSRRSSKKPKTATGNSRQSARTAAPENSRIRPENDQIKTASPAAQSTAAVTRVARATAIALTGASSGYSASG